METRSAPLNPSAKCECEDVTEESVRRVRSSGPREMLAEKTGSGLYDRNLLPSQDLVNGFK